MYLIERMIMPAKNKKNTLSYCNKTSKLQKGRLEHTI